MSKQSEQSFKVLKRLARNRSILFVQDNEKVREQTYIFLEKLFNDFYIAADATDAMKLLRRYQPDIVVVDLTLSAENSFGVVKDIRSLDKDVLIVVLSSSKKVESLSRAIDLAVFQYIFKPISAYILSQTLVKATLKIKEKEQMAGFDAMNKVFTFEDTLMVAIQEQKMLKSNKEFLSFFNVESLDDFQAKNHDIIDYLITQKAFLQDLNYSKSREAFMDMDKSILNVKLMDKEGKKHHFFLSVNRSLNGDSMILSFKDITHLGFLELFGLDKDACILTSSLGENGIKNYIKAIFDSGAEIKFRNYYKGVPISSKVQLESVTNEVLKLVANPRQFRAIDLECKTRLESPMLPRILLLDKIEKLDDTDMSITFQYGRFVAKTPLSRRSIRFEVDANHLVGVFKNENQLPMIATVKDISMEAVRLHVNNWMKEFSVGDSLEVDMVLNIEKEKSFLNTNASIYSIMESDGYHEVILTMSLTEKTQEVLKAYIIGRQTEITREFRALI